MAKKHIRNIICTECWWQFKELTMFLEMDGHVIKCPDCGFEGRVVGHYRRGMVYCEGCWGEDCGINANRCDCACHTDLVETRNNA